MSVYYNKSDSVHIPPKEHNVDPIGFSDFQSQFSPDI